MMHVKSYKDSFVCSVINITLNVEEDGSGGISKV